MYGSKMTFTLDTNTALKFQLKIALKQVGSTEIENIKDFDKVRFHWLF